MKLLFEPNKIENTIRIFQSNGMIKTRIASRYNSTGKITLANIYRRQIEESGASVKEVCEVLESEYNNWMYSTSPLRNLTREQGEKLIRDMKAINILSVCFQDSINSLKVLDGLDLFGEVTKDLQQLRDSILSFTEKVSKITGIDAAIEMADIADEVNNLIEDRMNI
ncbi:hypothetical protein D0T84_00995 [Dysgonomonas sp. 521]|uniref:hypothetical protein n=1 Tax=Dysgonomonas sp. 521 TaxID=2302932 RepID=UPI0013D3E30F|nr:hypothetical protein [Dysgonomonas sp. 521]NDV93495.1 hypothetical protein [Dysgonomonas sp. 521]